LTIANARIYNCYNPLWQQKIRNFSRRRLRWCGELLRGKRRILVAICGGAIGKYGNAIGHKAMGDMDAINDILRRSLFSIGGTQTTVGSLFLAILVLAVTFVLARLAGKVVQ
jgi:hypothetical protein